MDYKDYWTSDSLKNLVAGPSGNPEGFDVVSFLQGLLASAEAIKVHEIGCGTGRLCTVADPMLYQGTDLNPHAIDKAKQLNPGYRFSEVDVDSEYPEADVTMAYTVFLHMDDETLSDVIGRISKAGSRYILVAEILGREWRRSGNPPVFNRDLDDYLEIMLYHGYYLYGSSSKVYQHYRSHSPEKNVRLYGLLFKTFDSAE